MTCTVCQLLEHTAPDQKDRLIAAQARQLDRLATRLARCEGRTSSTKATQEKHT